MADAAKAIEMAERLSNIWHNALVTDRMVFALD